LSRRQEGQGQKTPHPGGHRGFRTQGEGPQCQGDGLRGNQDSPMSSGRAVPSPTASVGGGGLARREEGSRLGREDPGLECGPRPAPTKARPGSGVDEVGCRVGQRGRGCGLARTVAPQRLPGVAKEVGCVERTLAWIEQNRRMSKDYERLCASGEALVYAAMIRLMRRRLTRL
jgi:hypothetical protein